MDEIEDKLWIGNNIRIQNMYSRNDLFHCCTLTGGLSAALDAANLKKHGILGIMTVDIRSLPSATIVNEDGDKVETCFVQGLIYNLCIHLVDFLIRNFRT